MAWNGNNGKNTNGTSAAKRPVGGTRKSPSVMRGAFAAFVVVALAASVFLAARQFLNGGDGGGDAAEPRERPSQKPTAQRPQTTPATGVEKPVAAPEKSPDARQAVTGDWQMVNGFKVPKGARLVRNSLTNRRERVFARASDALIASYLQQPQGGVMPPPLPMVGNAEKKFLESLATPIEILDTDSEEVRRLKESVIIAREQIKQRMDEGESFEAILNDHWKLSAENAKIRRDAQRELDAIYASGDKDGAEKYRRVIDIALQQMGVEGLDEPMTHAERKRRRHEENEAREAAAAAEEENGKRKE
ncbi:MAG: hypothetical protein II840_14540 [Kiritimatiellae bacterium]|nr:hypothetical protein [Kiritimatiellia bacterium]